MSDRSRISQSIPIAVAYVDRTDNYWIIIVDPMNNIRLGVTAEEVAEWHTKRLAIDDCYLKWSDLSQKTTPVNTLMVRLLNEFREFANPILDRIAASLNLNETDEVVFNLVGDSNHADPSHRETPIMESCNDKVKAIGGGQMAHHVKSDPASARNHILAGATGFQSAYTITSVPTPVTDPENTISKSYTSANAVQKLGAINSGKYLNHCERWVYGPHDDFDGPYSASQSDLIH